MARQNAILIDKTNAQFACQLFKMLGDLNRRWIVCALMDEEHCVADLAERVGMEQSALSHQLRNLKAALVRSKRRDRNIVYGLDDEHIHATILQAIDHARHIQKGGLK